MAMMTSTRGPFFLIVIMSVFMLPPPLWAEEVAQGPRQVLTEALASGDPGRVHALVDQLAQRMGVQAGMPDSPDVRNPVPDAALLTPDAARRSFAPMVRYLRSRQIFAVGEDPRRNTFKPRDVASAIDGCVAALDAGCSEGEAMRTLAIEAGDYLLWTQEQGGAGLIPFPASSHGKGKVFEQIGAPALERIAASGTEERYLRNGWFIEDADLNDGGLQVDNGLCGVALLGLARVTGEERFRVGALRAARWASTRPCVVNWNYNAFSVELLAEAFRDTGEEAFLAAAVQRFRLGIAPGQLRDGPHAGRWIDGHNALPNYHFILVRCVARLVSVLPADHPARVEALHCLSAALAARLGDYRHGVVPNVESSLEALLIMEHLLPDAQDLVGDHGQEDVLMDLLRFPCAQFAAGQVPTSPRTWGMALRHLCRGGSRHD